MCLEVIFLKLVIWLPGSISPPPGIRILESINNNIADGDQGDYCRCSNQNSQNEVYDAVKMTFTEVYKFGNHVIIIFVGRAPNVILSL